MKIADFRELDKEAIPIGHVTTIVRPLYQKKKPNQPREEIACKEVVKIYGTTKYYMAFISGSVMKVVPKLTIFEDILKNEGYKKVDPINIPFSVERAPLDVRRSWRQLVHYAEKEWQVQLREKCLDLAGRLELSSFEADLKYCIAIPPQGANVEKKNHNQEEYETIRPITVFLKDGRNLLGRYNIENGICIFVYRDGTTYLTKSKVVQENLKNGGYIRDFEMDVPFSDGGEFMNPSMKYRWENL